MIGRLNLYEIHTTLSNLNPGDIVELGSFQNLDDGLNFYGFVSNLVDGMGDIILANGSGNMRFVSNKSEVISPLPIRASDGGETIYIKFRTRQSIITYELDLIIYYQYA